MTNQVPAPHEGRTTPEQAPVRPDTGIRIYGHRGASGYRPEHTLASYELAARTGADHIETDVVSTEDGVLVARHENEISGTTDVADHPEFADRRTTRVIDGAEVTGWFTEDFTLVELKSLRAKERLPRLRQRNTIYDARFEIPTLKEIIDLARRLSQELAREIGIAPETKHPSYFRSIGLPLEPALIDALVSNGLNTPSAGVAVQSFEVGNLKELNRSLHVDLVQLLSGSDAPWDLTAAGDPRTCTDMVTPRGLSEIATYADVIGPDIAVVIPRDQRGYLTEPTGVVDDAHAAGLRVVPYTVRSENEFLPADFRSSDDPAAYGDVFGFYRALFEAGVDGVFTDQPDTADLERQRWTASDEG